LSHPGPWCWRSASKEAPRRPGREDGHEPTALVLLGPRQHYLAKRLPTDDRLIVLSKPIKMKDVQDALAQLLPVA